jgi:hypothetical protein
MSAGEEPPQQHEAASVPKDAHQAAASDQQPLHEQQPHATSSAVAVAKLRAAVEDLQEQNSVLKGDAARLQHQVDSLQQVMPWLCSQLLTAEYPCSTAPGCALACNQAATLHMHHMTQACDDSLAQQSALKLAHRQEVSSLQDTLQGLQQQVSAACGMACTRARCHILCCTR